MFSDNFDRFANIKIFTNCVERKLFIYKFVHNISENVLLKYNTVCIKWNLKEGGGHRFTQQMKIFGQILQDS